MRRPLIFLSGLLALTPIVSATYGCKTSAAEASPQPKEWVKYLNPMPRKNYSLNESQDRAIKKKGFKSETIAGAKPVANRELGFFALLDTATVNSELTNSTGMIEKLLDKPEVNGISVIIPWRDLAPEEEKYDWSKIEKLLAICKQKNKTLILRVSTCGSDNSAESDTPNWIYEAGVKFITYKGTDGKDHKMPIFWDSTYLAKWGNFVADLGAKFDKNESLHSVGITGGGVLGGTPVVPEMSQPLNKVAYKALEEKLTKEHNMSQRQLVEHWKYVADIFPKAFPTARLNFDIDPTTPNRAGQDSLDEISDYLVYRYGQRIYLTRQNIGDAKHGFDQYRVLLKFHADTLTGYQLLPTVTPEEMTKLAKNALDDGVSFVEVPPALLNSDQEPVKKALEDIRSHLGYQLVSQKVTIPAEVKAGEKLKASFTFSNLGAAGALRPVRNLDRDVPSSYIVQIELRDANGKAIALLRHTPGMPTNKWKSGQPITWESQLATKSIKPGEYTAYLSVIEPDTKRKLQILNAISTETPSPETAVNVGKLKVQ
jgi:hypothetical protein